MIAGYVLGLSDFTRDFIIADPEETPRVLYRTLQEAENALRVWIKTFKSFNPALYGEVYPYEHTSALKELERTGRAVYGWGTYDGDDEEGIRPRPLCIFSIPWSS
jgi:hypothetical protein